MFLDKARSKEKVDELSSALKNEQQHTSLVEEWRLSVSQPIEQEQADPQTLLTPNSTDQSSYLFITSSVTEGLMVPKVSSISRQVMARGRKLSTGHSSKGRSILKLVS